MGRDANSRANLDSAFRYFGGEDDCSVGFCTFPIASSAVVMGGQVGPNFFGLPLPRLSFVQPGSQTNS